MKIKNILTNVYIIARYIFYNIFRCVVIFIKYLWSSLKTFYFEIPKKPIEGGMLIVSVCMLVVSIYTLCQTREIWKANEESSNRQHEERLYMERRYTEQDYILKRKLNEIEVTQEAAMQKIGMMLDKSATITEQIAEANKQQADIATRMMTKSEAHLEMRSMGVSFPKNCFKERNHSSYAADSTVILVALKISNQSSEAIDILGAACKFPDGFRSDRSFCGANSVLDENNEILRLDTWVDFYDGMESNNLDILNETIKQSIGTYYADFHEYPMSFHMKPYEEKIGFMFFHRDAVFHADEYSIKVGIRTNRGVFYKDVQVVPLMGQI